MRASHGCALILLFTLTACAGKKRPFADEPYIPSEQEGSGTAGSSAGVPPVSGLEPPIDSIGPDDEAQSPVGGLDSSGAALGGSASLACEADACTSPDAGPAPAVCVPTGPRDCTSDLDNDCDGQPDNTPDDVCECVGGTSEPCDEHPGLDGQGQCRAGVRTCLLDEVALTTAWGECVGAVGPGEADSCAPGDDTDCDGTPNEGCSCVDGETQSCGSNTNTGPCQIGTSTCVDGRFGPCVGAVAPAGADSCSSRNDDSNCNGIPFDGCSCVNGETQSCGETDTGVCQLGTRTCVNGAFGQCVGQVNARSRDCRSQQDNNCDGQPDNTIDSVCQCAIGQTQPCQQHPQDGVGRCRAGSQQCLAGQNNSSSFFGACSGSVGPGQRDCRSTQDNDCDGRPDNTIDNVCRCAVGSTQACQTHPGLDGIGRCRAGAQTCVAGGNNSSSDFGACTGSVGPAAADSCTVAGDDANCNGDANDGCACGSGVGSTPLPLVTRSVSSTPFGTPGGVLNDTYFLTDIFTPATLTEWSGEILEFRDQDRTFRRKRTAFPSGQRTTVESGTFQYVGNSVVLETDSVECGSGGVVMSDGTWLYSVGASGLKLQAGGGLIELHYLAAIGFGI